MSTKKILIYIGCFFLMSITTTVSPFIGIVQVNLVSNALIFVLLFADMFDKRITLGMYFDEEKIILFISLILIIPFNFFMGGIDFAKSSFFFIVAPILTSVYFRLQKLDVKKNIQIVVIFFFVLNCTMSIIEKIQQFNFFPNALVLERLSQDYIEENFIFRSSAFLGHPLNNALCMSIIMGFIMISNFKIITKSFFIILGISSFLCFNARGATIVWVVIILITLFYHYKNNFNRVPFGFNLILICSFILFYYLIVEYGFGDRFLKIEIFDGSAKTRLDISDSFDDVNLYDMIFGNVGNFTNLLEGKRQGGFENSYIVLITKFGLISFIIMLITYYNWIKKLLQNFTVEAKMVIICSFILVGSLNNSLADIQPWTFFGLCIGSFIPDLNFKR